jgi:hypothetical protein
MPILLDANCCEWRKGGSPRYADSPASDADAIGIYRVHIPWTIVDGSGPA